MNLADEIHKLEQLHWRGALTDAEFARAKARLIDSLPVAAPAPPPKPVPPPTNTSKRLANLELEQALARLDRDWQQESERYKVNVGHGNRAVPTRGGGIAVMLLGGGGGVLWLILMASLSQSFQSGGVLVVPGVMMLLMGLLFINASFGLGQYLILKAEQYTKALRSYHIRRQKILDQHKG